jgi:hypothetical protein
MALTLTYDTQLSRVRVAASALSVSAVSATVERSTDQVRWSTVRGAGSLAVTAQAASVDDYEFAPDVVDYYRVTAYDAGGAQTDQVTAFVTPTLTQVWLKSVARPFLNRQVIVQDYSEVERDAHAGIFVGVGAKYPIVVNDLRGSDEWALDVLAETRTDRNAIDALLDAGDVILVHVPADVDVPGGYVTVGRTRQRRTSRMSTRRIVSLPCTEVAAPGPDVVGATSTWQTVVSTYATWADVLAAHATWASVLELIGSPTDVIVL